MKVKWKITISILAFFAVLVSVSSLFYLSPSSDKMAPDAKMELPDAVEQPPPPIKELPDIVESPSPPSRVDRLLNEMEFGTIAFNAPTNINIDDSHQIQLILSLAETVESLKQAISQEGEKIGATIRVSDRMEARLSGYMFQITAITSEIQAVSKSQRTEWQWEIHPKEEGRHRLHLTLTALLEIDGHSTPRAIRTFDKIIEVHVTAKQKITNFLMNNWEWLWTAILVPIAGWLWKRRRKKAST